MDYTDNLPEFLLFQWANVCLSTPFSVLSQVFCLYPSALANICEQSFPLLIRSPNSLGSWNNVLSSLWYISDMLPSWNGEFSSKSKLNIGANILYILWILIMCHSQFERLYWGSKEWIWMERSIWQKGVIIYYSVICIFYGMCWIIWYVHCLFFLISILVLPGISCNKLDGWLIVWLMGSGFFLFDPALPWPICSLSKFPCLGRVCCFSGLRLGFKFFLTPWTSRSLIPLDLAWDHSLN